MLKHLKTNTDRNFLKKYKISPLTASLFIFTLMFSVVLFESAVFYVILMLLLFFFSVVIKKQTLILMPFKRFYIFLIFSFLFSYLNFTDIYASAFLLLKLIILLVLSLLFNTLIDLKELIQITDKSLQKIKPAFLRTNLRKVIYTLFLGLLTVENLFKDASQIKSNLQKYNPDTGIKDKFLLNIEVLKELFIQCFNKAEQLEIEHGQKNEY